ncbi:hypothetical protein [Pontibacillus salicampi]|uniref:hypothetical protein n=1 Tax=Pontibacillus salicampi TaxID=1449801 RepID=UPI00366BA28E
MDRIKFMVKAFMIEAIWFKVLILSMFFITIVFSSSALSNNPYLESVSKLAAAVIFIAYSLKVRNNRIIFSILTLLAAVSIVLAIRPFF